MWWSLQGAKIEFMVGFRQGLTVLTIACSLMSGHGQSHLCG